MLLRSRADEATEPHACVRARVFVGLKSGACYLDVRSAFLRALGLMRGGVKEMAVSMLELVPVPVPLVLEASFVSADPCTEELKCYPRVLDPQNYKATPSLPSIGPHLRIWN